MIVDELKDFRNKLMKYIVYRKKHIIEKENLTKKEQAEFGTIYEEISISAGKYAQLIKEYTDLEKIPTSAGLQDVWNWAFSFEQNTLVLSALSDCLQATSRTIGNLEDDIKKGVRDKQGKVIEKPYKVATEPPKAFISHGKKSVALNKLEEFLRALGIEPLVVKEQPSLDKTLDDKVNYYLSQADFVIILATGDDKIGGKLHPRQNVIHEVGLAQKTHTGKIIYLLEEGTEFPSNIRPKVYEPFKQRNMMNAFLHIAKELRAYGMLRAVKP